MSLFDDIFGNEGTTVVTIKLNDADVYSSDESLLIKSEGKQESDGHHKEINLHLSNKVCAKIALVMVKKIGTKVDMLYTLPVIEKLNEIIKG